mgnify:FL=1
MTGININNIRIGFVRALPIFFSYVFIGMAYGITMAESGFSWYWSMLISLFVYTGAYQFVLISFLAGGVPILTLIMTALLMNSRQSFYGLTFLKDFNAMGKRRLFMIHSLTDEIYAIDCTLVGMPDEQRRDVMFWLALFGWSFWNLGTLLGGLTGQLLPFDFEGIDFCMTALFVTIFMDQWERIKDHGPAAAGLAVGSICLFIFGPSSFMLPALIIVSLMLLIFDKYKGRAVQNADKKEDQH